MFVASERGSERARGVISAAHHPNRVLLVSETSALREAIIDYLRSRQVEAHGAHGLRDAELKLEILKPDVTVLDIDMEDGDGLDFVEEIMSHDSVCLVVSDSFDVERRVRALGLGAYGYIHKPFDSMELYLRIRNILSKRAESRAVAGNPVLDLNGIKVDLVTRALVGRAGAPESELTDLELSMLRLLASDMGSLVTKDALAAISRGTPRGSLASRALDVSISRLRLKLKSSGVGVELRSVRGLGYLLLRNV